MTIPAFIVSILGYVFGAGGLLAFFIQLRNTKHTENEDAVDNWHDLYSATLENVKSVLAENKDLKQQISDMQTKIIELTVELENYKRFDRYVTELEVYINSLLHVIQPLVSSSAFKKLQASKPTRSTLDTEAVMNDISSKNEDDSTKTK